MLLRNYPGWAARGINPEDYISNGHNRDPAYERVPAASGRRLTTSMATATRLLRRRRPILRPQPVHRGRDRTITRIPTTSRRLPSARRWRVQPSGAPVASVRELARSRPSLAIRSLRAAAASQIVGGAVWVLPNKISSPYLGPVRPRRAQAVRRHHRDADLTTSIAPHLQCSRERTSMRTAGTPGLHA